MATEHVTAGEFERFWQHIDKRLDKIENKQDITNGRVSKLELNQDAAGKLSAKLSAGVAVLVTAVAQGVMAAIGGK